jgi:hypothetical protein
MLWKNVHVYTRQVVAGHWGFSPLGWPQEEGAGVSGICVSVSSHHPFYPVPQEPAAPCPLVSARTPLFPGEAASWPLPFPPHPWRKEPGSARPSPLQLFTPLGQTKGTLLCTGRVQRAVSSSCHCYSRRKWSSSLSHWLLDGMLTGSGWTCREGACGLGEEKEG